MKILATSSLIVASAIFLLTSSAVAQHGGHSGHGSAAEAPAKGGELIKTSKVDAAWLEAARKAYALDVCAVSGEKLGSMGDATEWVYRAKGQPDRLVKFCCDGCSEDFLADPAAAFAKVDAAAAKAKSKK
jgi:hypothetical protein